MTLQGVSNYIEYVRIQSLGLLATGNRFMLFPYDTATGTQSYNNPTQVLNVRPVQRRPHKYLAFIKGPGGITYAIFLFDNGGSTFKVTHVLFKHDVDAFIRALTGVGPSDYSRSLFHASSVEWVP